jgi:hypothetical protein
MYGISIPAVLVAALATFIVGGPWYRIFGATWRREANQHEMNKHPALVFGTAYVLSVIAAALLAAWLGPQTNWERGLTVGASVGVAFVATSFGINYAFGGRSLKLFAIDGGYHVLQFAGFGLILGVWP